MSAEDRTKWDSRYATHDGSPGEPVRPLIDLGELIPRQGTALDIAGGAGRNSIWLAQRGFDVTIVDISEVGLRIAAERAEAAGVRLRTLPLDIDREDLPTGPWDLILCTYFLDRPLFSVFPKLIRQGGALIVIHPTRSNLERHEKPPARFLLKDGELPGLIQGLAIEHYEEGWLSEGRHEAVVVARRREAED